VDDASLADPSGDCDVAVVGAGILGLAVARELLLRRPALDVRVLEKEHEVGLHQTGRNSGVIHAGIYYAPGSLKARLCVEGARDLYEYCDRSGIRAERCGKVIVAVEPHELPRLDELERRGRTNGVPGLRRLDAAGIEELEPHARGLAGLHSPATGIVDFREVARALASEVAGRGAVVATGCAVEGVAAGDARVALRHARGETRARQAVLCAGLWSDRLAVAAGAPADPRIVPFRGAYVTLRPERRSLVRSLIYPVPDPALPFLGVHLSRHADGEVLIGPTALLYPTPHGLSWPGTYRLMRRFWRTGLGELRRASSTRALASAAARYVPGVTAADLTKGWYGVRAQALARDGTLHDDFVFSRTRRALHVRNAPSPAATASLAIARLVADEVEPTLG
jgi:L-2-hydroxyglutarate oxidase